MAIIGPWFQWDSSLQIIFRQLGAIRLGAVSSKANYSCILLKAALILHKAFVTMSFFLPSGSHYLEESLNPHIDNEPTTAALFQSPTFSLLEPGFALSLHAFFLLQLGKICFSAFLPFPRELFLSVFQLGRKLPFSDGALFQNAWMCPKSPPLPPLSRHSYQEVGRSLEVTVKQDVQGGQQHRKPAVSSQNSLCLKQHRDSRPMALSIMPLSFSSFFAHKFRQLNFT